jgi:Lrp/AsnC family transcriptional regulator for asnA, asnC and gidA
LESGALRVLAVLDPMAVGLVADVLVCINVKPGSLYDVGDALSEMNDVIYVGYVTGRYDLIIEVVLRDPDDLLQFLAERITGIADIVSLETFFIMRNQKINYDWRLPELLPELMVSE